MAVRRLLGAQWLAIVFIAGVSFVLSVFIARRFGPEAFGVYTQAISFGTLLMILVDGGFGKLLMRETARVSLPLAEYSENLHGFAFGHACMTIMLLAIMVVLNPFGLHQLTLLATVGAFGATVIGQFSMAILRGQGRLVHDAAWQAGSRALTAATMVLALWLGADTPWQLLVAQCVGVMFFLLLLMRGNWVFPVIAIPRKIYSVVVPLIWLDLATVIYLRSDMLLCKVLGVAKADVGAYGLAFRLIEAFLLLASPVGLMLFRRFRLNTKVPNQASVMSIIRLALLAGGLGFVIFLLALPTADTFFRLFFGEGFALAGSLIKVLSLMLVFALANGVLGQGVFAMGLDSRYVWTATAAAVFNVGGNLVFMPEYGVWAAVWMTVATEVVLGAGLCMTLFRAWKTIPLAREERAKQ